jgi:cation:H+ antiporter
MSYIYLLSGLTLLLFAGDILVKGAAGLALKLSIPPIIVGLTIVAFGTSAPELLVSIIAALDGAPDIAIGNVVGSNIANSLLVLGLPSIIAATYCQEKGTLKAAIFMLGSTLLFIALAWNGRISTLEGLILVTALIVFIAYQIIESQKEKTSAEDALSEVGDVPQSSLKASLELLAGLIGLPIAAWLTVEGASDIARTWGISEAVIGLTIVALGTSLPELATTIMAVVRKHASVGVGNIIGSNIFNLLSIVGITALITPIPVAASFLQIDVWIMLAASAVIMPYILLTKPVGRLSGSVMTLLYLGYIASAFILGNI